MLHEIDSDLRTAETTLTHWAAKYPALAKAAVQAEVTYELRSKAAYDEISNAPVPEGRKPLTVDAINAKTLAQCAKEFMAYKETKADLDTAKKLIAIAETTLSSIQTRAKLSSMEMALAR